MNRRGFIQAFMGAAAMVAVPKLPSNDGVALKSISHPILLHDSAHHDLSKGFGLAQVKAEGTSMPYDPGADFGKHLTEGLNKAFGDHYDDLDSSNLEELEIDIHDDDEEEETRKAGLPII